MNALDVLRVLRRHPFVLVFLLLLTVAGAGLVYVKLPINYQSTASEIVLPSNYVVTVNGKTRITTKVNPYRLTGDNPSQITASILVKAANGEGFRNTLEKKGVTSTPSIAISDTGGGVTIDVAATDRESGVTSKDITKILDELSSQLKHQQEQIDAPTDQYYALAPVNPPDSPSQVTSGRFKTSVISGVLGIILTLIIILIYDAQVRRRPRGRRRTDGSGRKRPAPDSDGGGADGSAARAAGARRDGDRRAGVPAGRDGGRGAGVTVPDRDAIGPRAR